VTPIDSGTDQVLIDIDPQPRPAAVAACKSAMYRRFRIPFGVLSN
jgi:hypothetical protein